MSRHACASLGQQRISAANGAEQILCFVPQLLEVGTDRQAADGHDEPPWEMPGVRSRRANEGSREPFFAAANQADSVLSTEGRRPQRLPTEYRSGGVDAKRNAVQLRCSMTNVGVHERIISSNLLVPHKNPSRSAI